MSRRIKLALASTGGLLAVGAGGGLLIFIALGKVEPFYAQAIETSPQELTAASRRMEERVAQLVDEVKAPVPQEDRWEATFTDDEVNGWLAVALKKKYRDLLPPEVVEPRVAFSMGRCRLGYRYEGERVQAVIALEGEAFMVEQDVAALRLRKARLGAIPLPMSNVVEEINSGAVKLNVPVEWTEREGDPVLLVAVADALSTDDEVRRLERIDVRDGELVLIGTASPRAAANAQGNVADFSRPANRRPFLPHREDSSWLRGE